MAPGDTISLPNLANTEYQRPARAASSASAISIGRLAQVSEDFKIWVTCPRRGSTRTFSLNGDDGGFELLTDARVKNSESMNSQSHSRQFVCSSLLFRKYAGPAMIKPSFNFPRA